MVVVALTLGSSYRVDDPLGYRQEELLVITVLYYYCTELYYTTSLYCSESDPAQRIYQSMTH